VPRRLLQLIGLGAVAVLALSGTAMAGDPGGGYSGGYCDHYRPSSNWGHGWWGHDGDGRYWNGWDDGNGYLDGHSSATGPVASPSFCRASLSVSTVVTRRCWAPS
jgi:hypothetical protein